ncbi:MAG TPA: hypothetical protein VMW50_03915 [Dehalococcoidia bacterium]|nr:hypothetical protein [Dehalococcoidia bacterium]
MKASAYKFASEVDQQMEALSDNDYHCRVGRGKRLREELYPLSRLALHFKQPGLEVEVQGFENSGRADGHIRITGFREREFEVQVTYASYGHEDKLRAKLMVSEGIAPGAGEIREDKKSGKIIATGAAVKHDEHIARIASAIVERFRAKLTKPYADGTVLLIAFEEVKLCGRTTWQQLLSTVTENGGVSGSPFARVYLFNGATNELHRAA